MFLHAACRLLFWLNWDEARASAPPCGIARFAADEKFGGGAAQARDEGRQDAESQLVQYRGIL